MTSVSRGALRGERIELSAQTAYVLRAICKKHGTVGYHVAGPSFDSDLDEATIYRSWEAACLAHEYVRPLLRGRCTEDAYLDIIPLGGELKERQQ